MKKNVKTLVIATISSAAFVVPASAGMMFDYMPRYEFKEDRVDASKDRIALSQTCVAKPTSDKVEAKDCLAQAEPVSLTASKKPSN